VCTPGTEIDIHGVMADKHCLNSTSMTYHGDQWARAEALVLGDSRIEHVVAGKAVLSYEKPRIGGGAVTNYDEEVKKDGTPLREGFLALQSESHPVEFRKVELLNLVGCTDPKAANYMSYFVKSDNSQCRK
jgi:hypothetical protein